MPGTGRGVRVLKFGGTSLGSPPLVERVVGIVCDARRESDVVVVVSAFGGVTGALLEAAASAASKSADWRAAWQSVRARHHDAVAALAPAAERPGLVAELEASCAALSELLQGAQLLGEATPRTLDAIAAHGERLSALAVAAAFRARGVDAVAVDARRLIVTDDRFGAARVDFAATDPRVRAVVAGCVGVPVVTGFVGATPVGETTTLGRGGSDYTAAILGAALGADAIEIWTDVDGVLTADPRLVPEARVLPGLSYAELMELSHFGAKVVHPPSVHPAREKAIPLLIRNTLRPEAPGTRIEASVEASPYPIRGLSCIAHVALMRLEGDGMVGVPGVAGRLFGALARREINVVLITQASSEHSICVAVAPEQAAPARRAVDEEFALERRLGLVEDLVVEDDLAVVAAVGEAMRERPGISGRLFGSLGRAGVNVRAVAQGSSELNISLVVARSDTRPALQAIHSAFFTPRRRRAAVVVAGVGTVGGALLDELREIAPGLREREELEIDVVGVLRRAHAWLDPEGLHLDGDWRAGLAARAPAAVADLLALFARTPGGVFVDCTASDETGAWYPALLSAGVAVVSANKRPFTAALADWQRLLVASREAPLLFEATVGAGLPVLSTLAALRRTGDRVRRVEGVLSGSVGAVLDRIAAGTPASQAVREAHAAGLTEPHPWDDLSGADVARKLCILGRGLGFDWELADVAVEPVLPGPGWEATSPEEFLAGLPRADAALAARQREAARRGERLCYLGVVEPAGARVGVAAVSAGHPAFALGGPDNLVAFTTDRYPERPLVVRGPGAGPRVTAAGLLADLLTAVERS